MKRTKTGLFLPNCEEIAEAIRNAGLYAFAHRAQCEDASPLTFNFCTGEFMQYASAEAYAAYTEGKPVVRVPYMCGVDARVLAKDFRAALQRLYAVAGEALKSWYAEGGADE